MTLLQGISLKCDWSLLYGALNVVAVVVFPFWWSSVAILMLNWRHPA